MLMRLLRQIAGAEGALTQADLARRLGVGEALLAPMIEELVRLGYLAPVEPGCASERWHCGGCSACSCAAQAQARLWALTGKGRGTLAKGT